MRPATDRPDLFDLTSDGERALRTGDRSALRTILHDLADLWDRTGQAELAREVRRYAQDTIPRDRE
ncbi:MAG: hypothetical protein R3E98_10870 [Gemmatimonadota bacterium]|nr:hypothetical protein [Gemmatimonadota bacterium]